MRASPAGGCSWEQVAFHTRIKVRSGGIGTNWQLGGNRPSGASSRSRGGSYQDTPENSSLTLRRTDEGRLGSSGVRSGAVIPGRLSERCENVVGGPASDPALQVSPGAGNSLPWLSKRWLLLRNLSDQPSRRPYQGFHFSEPYLLLLCHPDKFLEPLTLFSIHRPSAGIPAISRFDRRLCDPQHRRSEVYPPRRAAGSCGMLFRRS
ncbi:hypothetical protein VUR80DRAFT_4862 [Thermomyces stellatus]